MAPGAVAGEVVSKTVGMTSSALPVVDSLTEDAVFWATSHGMVGEKPNCRRGIEALATHTIRLCYALLRRVLNAC